MLFKDQKVVFNDVVVPNSVGKILTDIPYGRKKWQSFDLYLPKEMQGDTLIPLLLDLQGGGPCSRKEVFRKIGTNATINRGRLCRCLHELLPGF